MDPFAGSLASLLVVATYMTSNMWMADGGSAMLAVGFFVMGWIAQFYGHGVHEGRAPALLDNLFQARNHNVTLTVARPKQDRLSPGM